MTNPTGTTSKQPKSKTSALRLKQVSKRFDGTRAVDDLTIEVGDGELVVLVGPSGCGKSTLLRIAAGLTNVDSGTVSLHGEVVDDARTSIPPEQRNVGLVFQDHALFPHLSVQQNIAFGLPKPQRRNGSPRVAEMLKLVGLGGLAERYPHELSGGEQQRVAVARSLAPGPSLLLLDEPFASLDTNLRSQVRRDVIEIVRSTGIPAVLVTHEQSEALSIGDRLVVMHNGKISQAGTAQQVFHKPATQFVAEFMGEADFLPVVADGGKLTSEIATVESRTAIQEPLMMVRPDDVSVKPDSDGSAKIVATEFRGAVHLLTVQLRSGQLLRSEVSHTAPLSVGAAVSVGLHDGHQPVIVQAS